MFEKRYDRIFKISELTSLKNVETAYLRLTEKYYPSVNSYVGNESEQEISKQISKKLPDCLFNSNQYKLKDLLKGIWQKNIFTLALVLFAFVIILMIYLMGGFAVSKFEKKLENSSFSQVCSTLCSSHCYGITTWILVLACFIGIKFKKRFKLTSSSPQPINKGSYFGHLFGGFVWIIVLIFSIISKFIWYIIYTIYWLIKCMVKLLLMPFKLVFNVLKYLVGIFK